VRTSLSGTLETIFKSITRSNIMYAPCHMMEKSLTRVRKSVNSILHTMAAANSILDDYMPSSKGRS